ncbi:GAF domain-containing protein [Rhodococcus sp. MEB064]|uniref:GAF domain-containing protein n=1 Tax=Rhodococcus sp. MEB064 TaxID=1587522 RepID=UPI0005ACA455|nr:GAF domain-containing protein [Rhodococcus sp. MEB064]KIQ19044.1 diguanylate cyclase [Rhodococcus sp. MEB064]
MTRTSEPEPAVAAGEDPRRYAQLLTRVYDATMSGTRAPARPRDVIGDSWQRVMDLGVDPENDGPAAAVDASALEQMRRESGLVDILPDLTGSLRSVLQDSDNLLVVADRLGRVLWRSGSPAVLDRADRLGFVDGADWSEDSVGTNAIGTALVSRSAVQIFSAEHFVRSHHAWTCASSPIKDPRTGRVLGLVDVSGPAASVHPTTLALIDAVSRLAESQLREQHRLTLDSLRSVAAPMLAGTGRPALAVDNHGWVAALAAVPICNRVALPDDLTAGRAWVPTLGVCDIEPLPGGWMVRPSSSGEDVITGTDATPTTVRIDVSDPRQTVVEVRGELGRWSYRPSPRHAEILFLLAVHRGGRTAAELATDLFGDHGRSITVRAEMSRLRKTFAGLVSTQPYRVDDSAAIELTLPDDRSRILPFSEAPAVRAFRVQP